MGARPPNPLPGLCLKSSPGHVILKQSAAGGRPKNLTSGGRFFTRLRRVQNDSFEARPFTREGRRPFGPLPRACRQPSCCLFFLTPFRQALWGHAILPRDPSLGKTVKEQVLRSLGSMRGEAPDGVTLAVGWENENLLINEAPRSYLKTWFDKLTTNGQGLASRSS